MPKIKWGVSGSDVDKVEVEDREEFEPYAGPLPPKNTILLCDIKWIRYTKFNTGNKGLAMLLIVNEDRANYKKFNGCPMWENIVDTPANDWKIRQFCDAIGATGKDWDNCVIDSSDDHNVTKIGRIAMEGMTVEVRTKRGVNNEDEPRCEVAKFLPLRDDDGDDQPAGDADGGEAPF
jgi:hypothetical protein